VVILKFIWGRNQPHRIPCKPRWSRCYAVRIATLSALPRHRFHHADHGASPAACLAGRAATLAPLYAVSNRPLCLVDYSASPTACCASLAGPAATLFVPATLSALPRRPCCYASCATTSAVPPSDELGLLGSGVVFLKI
jgi:hypothetical protein